MDPALHARYTAPKVSASTWLGSCTHVCRMVLNILAQYPLRHFQATPGDVGVRERVVQALLVSHTLPVLARS